MCPEFFLVILYLVIILTINYFFFKLLKTYWLNILELNKFKNIFRLFKSSDLLLISNLFLFKKINSQNYSLLKYLNKMIESGDSKQTDDILSLGNIYKFLTKKFNFDSNRADSSLFYFRLLERQYLNDLKS